MSRRLEKQHHKGRPITETVYGNIERVWTVHESDLWFTYDEIEAESLFLDTIEAIIDEYLKR